MKSRYKLEQLVFECIEIGFWTNRERIRWIHQKHPSLDNRTCQRLATLCWGIEKIIDEIYQKDREDDQQI